MKVTAQPSEFVRLNMEIKIKLVDPAAKAPVKLRDSDACFDLYAVSGHFGPDYTEYDTGVAFEIPDGYCGLVFARSSISNKGMYLSNGVGVIDAPYRGTVRVRFYRNTADYYQPGERVAQIMFVPVLPVTLVPSDELAPSSRGTGGFGSTGQK